MLVYFSLELFITVMFTEQPGLSYNKLAGSQSKGKQDSEADLSVPKVASNWTPG